jgi:hypothetical protein
MLKAIGRLFIMPGLKCAQGGSPPVYLTSKAQVVDLNSMLILWEEESQAGS